MPWTHDTEPVLITKGPLILSIESVFFHWQRYPSRRRSMKRPPLHEPARPREIEQPYRTGHGHAFRFPFLRRGFVVGYWIPAELAVLEEEENNALLAAIEGAHIPGVTATEIATWSRGRIPWWRKLIGRLLDWWEDKGGTVPLPSLHEAVAPGPVLTMDDVEVIPYDGRIYDLEEARVRPPDAS